MPKKKKFMLQSVPIEHYAAEGKCVSRYNDKVIFIEGGVPGDVADIFVHKNKKDWAEARVHKIVSESSNRVKTFCDHFGICGGCKWQMLPYHLQLEYKEKQVKDQLKRIGRIEPIEYLPMIGCEENRYYRNKIDFTFSNKQYLSNDDLKSGLPFEKNVLGFHAPTYFDKIIDIEFCHLQHEPTNAIRNYIREITQERNLSYYDIRKHTGLMRNLMIRLTTTGNLMVNIVFAEDHKEDIEWVMNKVDTQFPEITSLNYLVNTKWNDTIDDQEVINYRGSLYIEEKLEHFRFLISTKSFFQTNTKQAEVLYQTVRKFAACTGNEVLYDLYCGTGSIGIFLSQQVGKIIGIERVPDAIKNAQSNAELNNIKNTYFFAGDVIDVCTPEFIKENGNPDVVVIDPPRSGCHESLLQTILYMKAPKVVYVSCNPATQARDLAILSQAYEVSLSQAVDMFPHTHHVENVVLLQLK